MDKFTRFSESILVKKDLKVTGITIKPLIADSTGTIWFTDLMVQEGDKLTGYCLNTETSIGKMRDADEVIYPPRHYNGIIRNSMTAVIFNLGTDTAGLDIKIYPNQNMSDISLSQGSGGHRVKFLTSADSGDEIELLATSRECLKNGISISKDGFYQYSASGDSKHNVALEEKKSIKMLVEFQEMEGGDDL